MTRNKKPDTTMILVGLALLGGAGYYFWKRQKDQRTQQLLQNQQFREAAARAGLEALGRMG